MMSRFKALKEEAWEANREIPRQGLALYTWGNVSAFDASLGVFAIKPSGVPYDELQWKQMVVLDLEGTVIEGDLNPSSDTPTHRILYRYFSERSPGAVTG
ncbi:MAG: L-ribulose-5-phosphate 4-epimerase, partial [Treponema sp.]|nr:L-ribulose-5-phosphate 4-epimerase [Treponema sp.]